MLPCWPIRSGARFLAALLLFLGCMGCKKLDQITSRTPVMVVDQQVRLGRREVRKVSFELRDASEVKVELAHLGGEPLFVYFTSKADLNEFEADRNWSYYTVLSEPRVSDRFDSGWHKITAPAVYSIILRPHDKTTEPQDQSVGNLRVMAR